MIARRVSVLVAGVVLLAATQAGGAVVTGQYAGTSQAKVITKYGQLEPAVQKGTVAFRVATDRGTGFKLRKQRAQCPGTPGAVVVDVTHATDYPTVSKAPDLRPGQREGQGDLEVHGERHRAVRGPMPHHRDLRGQGALTLHATPSLGVADGARG